MCQRLCKSSSGLYSVESYVFLLLGNVSNWFTALLEGQSSEGLTKLTLNSSCHAGEVLSCYTDQA